MIGMANNFYVVEDFVTSPATVVLVDDGTGIDWLLINGNYSIQSEIRLSWTAPNGIATSASGIFYIGNAGYRLIVEGLIENARGSSSSDWISGNHLANIIYGDTGRTGPGGADILNGDYGNDTIFGGSGDDIISGGNDNDRLFGDAGADNISGGLGIDTLTGGAGADRLSGGADRGDTVAYASSASGVQVRLTFGETTTGRGGDAQGDQINGFSNIIGSSHNDILTDTVKSTIAFGYNDNTFFGGGGDDQLFLGGGNDKGYGGAGIDRIAGEAGDDMLFGEGGTDWLTGGAGKDFLTGGAGADRFIFRTVADSTVAANGRDQVRDFSGHRGQGDRIDLAAIDAVTGTSFTNEAFIFIGAGGFTGVKGQLHYRQTANATIVEGDVNGDRIPDFAIELSGLHNLVAGDFFL
jgi:serralysin